MKRIIEYIFELNRFTKIFIQLFVDGILITFSFLLAWYLRLDENFYLLVDDIFVFLCILIPLTLLIFYKLTFYKNIVRFISTPFIKFALLGSIVSCGLIYFSAFIFDLYLPRSIPLIYLLLLLTFTWNQIAIKFYISLLHARKINRIVIIDANKDSIKIANFLQRDNENKDCFF